MHQQGTETAGPKPEVQGVAGATWDTPEVSQSKAAAPAEQPRSQENQPRLRARGAGDRPSSLRCTQYSLTSPARFQDTVTKRVRIQKTLAKTHLNPTTEAEYQKLTQSRSPFCLSTNYCQ